MTRECSKCDSDAVATLRQKPFCEEHGREKLEELETKKDVVESEVEAAKKEYERLRDKYGVESYGELENRLNAEGDTDIDESDVSKFSEAEDELALTRRELETLEVSIKNLKKSL